MMSHLIKIYAVCKFNYFRLWYLKSHDRFIEETSFLQAVTWHLPYHRKSVTEMFVLN